MSHIISRLRHENENLRKAVRGLKSSERESRKLYLELKHSIAPMKRELDALRGPLPLPTPTKKKD